MTALLLQGVRIWDGIADSTPREPGAILIRDGRIEALGDVGPPPPDAIVQRLEAGSVAVPGLVDSHVHLCLDPALRTPAEQQALPHEQVRAAVRERANALLRAGVTTARDLGGGDGFEIELRDQINRGDFIGPRILCAGQPLTSVGGHCHFWGGEAEGETAIAAVIERQVAAGVDWIKVMATGGLYTKGTRASAAQFTAAELSFARRLASEHARPVATHCHGTEGIRNSALARVRSIEHCSFAGAGGFGTDLQPGLCDDLAEAEVFVSPTINAGWQRFRGDTQSTQPTQPTQPSGFFRDMSAVFQQLLKSGVQLIASTDAGIPNVRHGDLPRALVEMQAFTGRSPAEVLRSATSTAAAALQLDQEMGALRPGLSADLLILPADPLEDLGILQNPLGVFIRGQRVEL